MMYKMIKFYTLILLAMVTADSNTPFTTINDERLDLNSKEIESLDFIFDSLLSSYNFIMNNDLGTVIGKNNIKCSDGQIMITDPKTKECYCIYNANQDYD